MTYTADMTFGINELVVKQGYRSNFFPGLQLGAITIQISIEAYSINITCASVNVNH